MNLCDTLNFEQRRNDIVVAVIFDNADICDFLDLEHGCLPFLDTLDAPSW
jgi:hypothetical protein